MGRKDWKVLRAEKAAMIQAKIAAVSMAQREPPPATWSANMPAYSFTTLCPLTELREAPANESRKQ